MTRAIATTQSVVTSVPAMTNHTAAWRLTACVLTVALAVGSTGCKSAGGSKWAWNPWSKPKLDAATALAGSTPKLPSDGATPLIEGADPVAPAAEAIATVKTQTPPAIGGMAPAFEAVAKAVPTIDKPAPEPNWKPYPTGQPAATPTKPATTAVASAGPYDPNGYKPQAPAAVAQAAGRYGGGDRYASAAPASTPAFDPSGFADLPPVAAATKSANRYGDRYAAAQQTATATADRYASTATEMTQQATNTVDRYATAAAQTMDSAKTEAAAATQQAIGAPAAALSAVAQATSVAAPPAYPTTPATSTPTPDLPTYPIATATAGGRYGAESATVGTLPPETSTYASRQPVTPIEPASASTTNGSQQGSVVRLTTLPGEYRPGGTSTYQSTSTSGAVKRY